MTEDGGYRPVYHKNHITLPVGQVKLLEQLAMLTVITPTSVEPCLKESEKRNEEAFTPYQEVKGEPPGREPLSRQNPNRDKEKLQGTDHPDQEAADVTPQ